MKIQEDKVKGKWWRSCIAVNGTPSQSYVVSLAIMGSHSDTPPWPRARQADTLFTYPRGMEGWVDLGDLLHTDYRDALPASSHPSK